MPIIIDKQKKLHEIARIRIGEQVPVMEGGKQKVKDGKPVFRPAMRETFRLTSVDRSMLEAAQKAFGGELAPWEGHPGQFELFTERTQLKVIIHLQHSLSEDFEMWSGGGCQRRCDGVECKVPGKDGYVITPCQCPEDPAEREKQAAWGKACKMTTRLNVMLSEVPALGLWRLESHGKIFNSEVTAAIEMMEVLGLGNGQPVYCVLTIQQQEIKKPGQAARKFSIPKLTLDPAPINFTALVLASQKTGLPPGEAHQALNGHGAKALTSPTPPALEPPATNNTAKEAAAYLKKFTFDPTQTERLEAFKAACAQRQESWAKRVLAAAVEGGDTEALLTFLEAEPYKGPTVSAEPEVPYVPDAQKEGLGI